MLNYYNYDTKQRALDRAWENWHHHVNRHAVQYYHRPHKAHATHMLPQQNEQYHLPTAPHGAGCRHGHGDDGAHIYYAGRPMKRHGEAFRYPRMHGRGVGASPCGDIAQYYGGAAVGRRPGRYKLDASNKNPGNTLSVRKQCNGVDNYGDLDLVPGAGTGPLADPSSPGTKCTHGTQVRPGYVPNPNNDAIPDNIAGEYYMVYKLEHPTPNHDLDMQIPYVELILQTLKEDKNRALRVLEVLSDYDDVDERNLIYSMAELISGFPVLFLGLSTLLHTYCIERRAPALLSVNMEHIDSLFDMAQAPNDADIATIMRSVSCFREFAKHFLFEANMNVTAALVLIEKSLSALPDDTQDKINAVQSAVGVSHMEALHHLVFCRMNTHDAIRNVHQHRSAMKIVALVQGCTEDRAQRVLKQHNNNVHQAIDYLLGFKDPAAAAAGASAAAPMQCAEGGSSQHTAALPRAVQRFMDSTGEDAACAREWLQKYGANNDEAIQQFLECDDRDTKAGRIIIDATAATLGLKSIELAGERGHCFFLAVSQQLSLHGVSRTFQQLRAIAAQYIADAFQAGTTSPMYSVYFCNHALSTQSFKEWCTCAAATVRYSGSNPAWADDLAISSLLGGLLQSGIRVKLRIIASRQSTGPAGRITELEQTGELSAAGPMLTLTLTIGHVYGRHYLGTCPLVTASLVTPSSGRTSTTSNSMHEDDGRATLMTAAASRESEGSLNVDALRLLSDTATQQPRAPGTLRQGSFWSKYDEEGIESAVQWAKTENANGRRMKRPVENPELQTARLPVIAAPVAKAFPETAATHLVIPIAAPFPATSATQLATPLSAAPFAAAATTPLSAAPFAAAATTHLAAPFAMPAQKPTKKSKKPAWPGSVDVINAALQAHTEAWKKHPAYNRWLSESQDNVANPARCKLLFNQLEQQRTALLKQIHETHLQESAKK